MSTITRLTLTARQRLLEQIHDERGDGPVDNAIIIGLSVTIGLALVAVVTAAFNGYLPSIK